MTEYGDGQIQEQQQMSMYTGIVRQNITADGSGRWSQHIGQERGNARIEVRQMKTGRPWSGMAVSNVVQLPALGNPGIDQMNTAQDHIYGWATPGATVKVHVHGVFIRDIGTDPSRKMVDTFRVRKRKCQNRSKTDEDRKTMEWYGSIKCSTIASTSEIQVQIK